MKKTTYQPIAIALLVLSVVFFFMLFTVIGMLPSCKEYNETLYNSLRVSLLIDVIILIVSIAGVSKIK